MHKRILRPLVTLVILPVAALLAAQDAPVLDQGYKGAAMVSGRVTPGQGSVTIYDASHSPRIKLGTSQSIDGKGNFAAMVQRPLILGHKIIAVCGTGATSSAMIVAARPRSSTHRSH